MTSKTRRSPRSPRKPYTLDVLEACITCDHVPIADLAEIWVRIEVVAAIVRRELKNHIEALEDRRGPVTSAMIYAAIKSLRDQPADYDLSAMETLQIIARLKQHDID
jgi:hypothetical protein